ncbi:arsenate reductase ArsC [Lactococcus petauri]|uniref:arsenate reductase/protein-tyrosine-phosphatase family protein n=1 Tax=Lactococcus petauri TaxID=1940789 RepID=UPI0013FE36B8|nr:arsenate reductase ArsC [Lactococcus petauri]NHI78644.1 arsenate reductase ArsC [Lactococcus petauri]
MVKIAFICVHNSCRSQIAEALGKKLAGDKFEFYSAGTEIKPQINQDAVRLMKEIYDIDMEKTQSSKLLQDIPRDAVFKDIIQQIETKVLALRKRDFG